MPVPPMLARQLAGAEPLNLFRLCYLPLVFKLAWLTLMARRIGAELITADQLAILRGALVLGKKRMLKAGLDFIADRKVG